MSSTVDDLFERLDDWRHLPNYQLERRADIFFGLYLPDFLGERFDIDVGEVVPELPIKRDLIWPSHPTNKSVKVDYAVFGADRDRCLFVELKTDVGSRRVTQDHYLEKSRNVGLVEILDGLKSIVQASSAHRKYFHLLSKLEELECVGLPEGLADYIFPEARPGLRELQDDIEVCVDADEFDIEVIYVQPVVPEASSKRVVGFEELASWLEGRDEMAEVFAEYLRRWITPAGVSEGAERLE